MNRAIKKILDTVLFIPALIVMIIFIKDYQKWLIAKNAHNEDL